MSLLTNGLLLFSLLCTLGGVGVVLVFALQPQTCTDDNINGLVLFLIGSSVLLHLTVILKCRTITGPTRDWERF